MKVKLAPGKSIVTGSRKGGDRKVITGEADGSTVVDLPEEVVEKLEPHGVVTSQALARAEAKAEAKAEEKAATAEKAEADKVAAAKKAEDKK